MKRIIRVMAVVSMFAGVNARARTDCDQYFAENWFVVFEREIDGVEMCIDPRIELFQIVNMIGGNPAINATEMDYKKAIFEHFEPYRDHPAFTVAREKYMAVFKDIDAPYSMLITLNKDLTFREDLKDNYWEDNADVQELLDALRQFAMDSDFVGFFNDQAEYYHLVLDNTAYTLRGFDERSRMVNYFGVEDPRQHQFYLVLNALGFGNFGKGLTTPFEQEHYAIVSPGSGNGSIPIFKEYEILELFWHEIGHSFTNPLINEHWQEFEALSALHEPIRQSMSAQYYPDWRATCYEHLVRAVVCRLCADRFGEADAEINELRRQLGQKFIYTECIADALKSYEQNREQYPSLDQFMPQIIMAMQGLDQDDIDRLLARAETIRTPAIDDIPCIGDIDGREKVLVIYGTGKEDEAANRRLVEYVQSTYTHYDFIADTEALEMDLSDYDLFVIGTPWGNRFLGEHLPELPIRMTHDSLIAGKQYDGTGYAFITGWVSPANPEKVMVVYTAQHPDDLLNFTWIPRGATDYMVVRHLIPMRADDYMRSKKIWTCY